MLLGNFMDEKLSEEEQIRKIREQEEKTLELENVIPIERKKGRPKKESPNIVVPISMPPDLKAKIDNDEEGKINRSALVCKILYLHYQ